MFRIGDSEIDIDYADGNIEAIKSNSPDGFVLVASAPDGGSSCTAWYPDGHVFSREERKAAVLQYASRLGVAAPVVARKHHGPHSTPRSCGGAVLANVAEMGTGTVGAGPAGKNASLPLSPPALEGPSSQTGMPSAAGVDPSSGLQQVAVKISTVHLIDEPRDALADQPSVRKASFDAVAAAPPLAASGLASSVPPPNVSECLSVASDGEYWGFQNRCARTVQFAYCEMSDINPLISCQRASVSGSVAANGFSRLIGDRSLSEQGIHHDFRWMACDGGAGEVVPHLDSVAPPAGRCLRTGPPVTESGPG
jgi:hypothetical protein